MVLESQEKQIEKKKGQTGETENKVRKKKEQTSQKRKKKSVYNKELKNIILAWKCQTPVKHKKRQKSEDKINRVQIELKTEKECEVGKEKGTREINVVGSQGEKDLGPVLLHFLQP